MEPFRQPRDAAPERGAHPEFPAGDPQRNRAEGQNSAGVLFPDYRVAAFDILFYIQVKNLVCYVSFSTDTEVGFF